MVSPRRPPGLPGSLPLTEKRDHYLRLMAQGVNNAEACRIVGVGRGTGIRWRYGRTVKNPDGSSRYYAAKTSDDGQRTQWIASRQRVARANPGCVLPPGRGRWSDA